jgi:hypothetical protein
VLRKTVSGHSDHQLDHAIDGINQQWNGHHIPHPLPNVINTERGEKMAAKEAAEQQTEALSFVTKKVLITFTQPICFLINDTPVMSAAVIAEYEEVVGNDRFDVPKHFRVIGMADGRKMSKSLQLHMCGYGTVVAAMVELD